MKTFGIAINNHAIIQVQCENFETFKKKYDLHMACIDETIEVIKRITGIDTEFRVHFGEVEKFIPYKKMD